MNQPKVKYSLSNWDLVTVNPNYKTWNWKDLFCFWGVNIQSVIGFSLIASLYIIYNLNAYVVFSGTILGSFLVYIFCNLIGKPSQKFGLPFAVLLRSSLGFNGAKFFGKIARRYKWFPVIHIIFSFIIIPLIFLVFIISIILVRGRFSVSFPISLNSNKSLSDFLPIII